MATLPVRKEEVETNNIIRLSIVNGKLGVKPNVRYNKDGSIDKRHPNKVAGVSSEVYGFTDEEVGKIIEVLNKRIENASTNNQKQIATRNKMMIVIGMNVGLRASDLCGLRFSYFFNEDGTFKDFYTLMPKKTRKQKKFVKIFFNQTVRKIVSDYVTEYPVEDLNEYMFKSRKGDGCITEKSLWKIIVDLASEAGLDKNVGSHSLRKTFGKMVFDKAEDKEKALVMLMLIFNHSSVVTTKQYIGIIGDEMEEIYNGLNIGDEFI